MKSIKLLLVDDEKSFLKVLAERLNMRDLKSTSAYSGKEAIALMSKNKYDVVVLDLKMPGMSGQEVAGYVKAKFPDTQIIILTGHGSDKEEMFLKEIGVYEYTQKPVNFDSLVEIIRRAHREGLMKAELNAAAIAFAEAGDFKGAVEILKKKDLKE